MTISRTTTASASKAHSASKRRSARSALKWALALGTALTPVWVLADPLPTGGTVAHGAAAIATPAPNTMTINQSSDTAIVNWDSFSIGQGNAVNITQPSADAALLNRVTGDTTSQIHGQLNANGRVFVVNPNGVFIGPTGSVNTGSFVASTLDIRNEDFATGQLVFEGDGTSAVVENAGTVQVVTGGYAALIGGKVKNSGTIQAPLGFVGLGAGGRVTLDLAGDGFLQVAVPTDTDDAGLEALIENSGTIQANGGTVQISAATARNAARHAINLGGVVEATTVSGRNGRITLGGGAGGKVTVTGRVRTTATRPAIQVVESARPQARPPAGGAITITGREITLAGAALDASGVNGGGQIRIGGEFQGGAGLPTAETLTVDAATTILADATDSGDGGRVILWSDERTTFAGKISARGGENGGNGGFAEVSGKRNLSFAGMADMRAPQGDWGELLLDPTDIEIVNDVTNASNQLAASDVEAQLALGDFSISTSNTFPSQSDDGFISVLAPLTWSAATELTLFADTSIDIDAPITASNGSLRLFAFAGAIAPILTGPAGAIDVAQFHLAEGDWEQVGSDLPGFAADNFVIGTDPGSSFLRATGGDGTVSSPYLITDVYGLQGMGTVANGAANFALANDIDASVTSSWVSLNAPVGGFQNGGFVPKFFDGEFDGRRFDISNLFVRSYPGLGSGQNAGLFSALGESAFVYRLDITNADIAGGNAGILAGQSEAAVRGVFASGTVTTFEGSGGGLVGQTFGGSISDSYTNVSVTDATDPTNLSVGSGLAFIGGIVGFNDGLIQRTNSSGSITHAAAFEGEAGGIAGRNADRIFDSYSDASVTANAPGGFTETRIGGIAGDNPGVIENVIATGPVAATGGCCAFVDEGGIVGADSADEQSILSSFWDPSRTGQATSGQNGETPGATNGFGQFLGAQPGDLAFFNDADAFTSAAQAGGWSFADTWSYPLNGSDQSRLYSTSPVINGFFVDEVEPEFVYNGTVNHLLPLADYHGGTSVFEFGPLGDSGTPPTTDAPVILSGADVGPQTFTFDPSFTSALGQAYSIRSRAAPASVTAAELEITVDSISKTYGDELVFEGLEFTVVGLQAEDEVTSLTITSDGAAADSQVADGPFDILGETPLGTGLENYAVSILPGVLTITPAALTITADNQEKPFGEEFVFAGTEFTVTGLVNEDTVTSATLSSAGAAADAPLTGEAGVAILITDPLGTGLENYEITLVNGIMIIAQGGLIITANDQTKVYGTELVFDGTEFTVTGLEEGDSVDSVTLTSAGAAAGAQVGDGPFQIVISDVVGTGLEDYELVLADGTLVITPAPLTVTADDILKQEGQVFTFAGTEFTASGLRNGDSVDSAVLTSDGASEDALIEDSPFTIFISDVTGSGLENYDVTTVDGTMTVANITTTPEVNPREPGSSTLPNPGDVIRIAFPGSEVEAGNVQSRGEGSAQQSLSEAEATFEVVDDISTELELAIQSCGSADQDFTNYMACLSASLDTYANALDQIATDLPSGLETVSATIRTARQEVQAAAARAQSRLATATSEAERQAIRRDAIAEARGALDTAKEDIRKAITLIRADDPAVEAVQVRTGNRIIQAFDTVDSSLARAVEL